MDILSEVEISIVSEGGAGSSVCFNFLLGVSLSNEGEGLLVVEDRVSFEDVSVESAIVVESRMVVSEMYWSEKCVLLVQNM